MTVQINGRFLTQPLTGVQRYAHEIVGSLDRRLSERLTPPPFDIDIVAPQLSAHTTSSLPTYRTVGLRQVGRLNGHAWEQFELRRELSNGFTVHLCNTAPVTRIPQAVVVHDTAVFDHPDAFSYRFRQWYRLMHKSLAATATHFVTVSEFSRGRLMAHLGLPRERVSVIHGAVDHFSRISPDFSILDRLNLREKRIFLSVGSLNPYKNFKLLLAAAPHLRERGGEVVVVGRRESLVFKTEANESSAVNFTGPVSDEELRALYESATLFVFPSLYEGFGLPPLEAMLCGCPVVASRAAAIPEVCGDGALYFEPNDLAGLCQQVDVLLESEPQCQAMIERGHAAAAKFSWDRSSAALLELFESKTSS